MVSYMHMGAVADVAVVEVAWVDGNRALRAKSHQAPLFMNLAASCWRDSMSKLLREIRELAGSYMRTQHQRCEFIGSCHA